MEKQNILFLYLKTGGGHLSGAMALAGAMGKLFPREINAIPFDPLPPGKSWQRTFLEKGYSTSVNDHPWMYPIAFEFSKLRPVMLFENTMIKNVIRAHLKEKILSDKINKIVILHFLLIQPVYDILKEMDLNLPVVTVVMDPFSPHPYWFYQKKAKLIVFSEKVKDRATHHHKLLSDNIFVHPLMLKKEFEKFVPVREIPALKAKYGFDPKRSLLLFAGGGDGIQGVDRFLEQALLQNVNAQIAIVCGKNEKLKEKCEKVTKKHDATQVKIYGFVDFMYNLMNMADLVVSKGGPATIMETLLLQKPLVVVYFIYGQEKGNVDFVVENQVGIYEPNPKKAIRKIKTLLEQPEQLKKIKEKIASLGIQNGTDSIAYTIYNLKT